MLFGAADLRFVGAGCEQGDRYLTRIDFSLDLLGPNGSARDALLIEPRVETLRAEIGLQTAGQLGARRA